MNKNAYSTIDLSARRNAQMGIKMKILGWVSIILIACTLLCGLWMRFGPGEKDVNFHAMLSIITILVCLVTIILYMIRIK